MNGIQLLFSICLRILLDQQRRLEVKGSQELNRIKHVIITSNDFYTEWYKNLSYDQDQLE